MKKFYVECLVNYTDNTGTMPYNETEYYSYIIESNSKKVAIEKAKLEAKVQFDDELNDNFDNITVEIDQCYETTDDARCS